MHTMHLLFEDASKTEQIRETFKRLTKTIPGPTTMFVSPANYDCPDCNKTHLILKIESEMTEVQFFFFFMQLKVNFPDMQIVEVE